MTAPTPGRIWSALGTPRAVRFISVGMLIYFLVIGALTFGYVKVQTCVTDYANQSAKSTRARADAATDDRRLNDAESRLEDSDRARLRANADALSDLLVTLAKPTSKEQKQAKFGALLKVDAESGRILDANEVRRQGIRKERAVIEAQRAKNPPPPPPSETC
jgi:hypothetical protein